MITNIVFSGVQNEKPRVCICVYIHNPWTGSGPRPPYNNDEKRAFAVEKTMFCKQIPGKNNNISAARL